MSEVNLLRRDIPFIRSNLLKHSSSGSNTWCRDSQRDSLHPTFLLVLISEVIKIIKRLKLYESLAQQTDFLTMVMVLARVRTPVLAVMLSELVKGLIYSRLKFKVSQITLPVLYANLYTFYLTFITYIITHYIH